MDGEILVLPEELSKLRQVKGLEDIVEKCQESGEILRQLMDLAAQKMQTRFPCILKEFLVLDANFFEVEVPEGAWHTIFTNAAEARSVLPNMGIRGPNAHAIPDGTLPPQPSRATEALQPSVLGDPRYVSGSGNSGYANATWNEADYQNAAVHDLSDVQNNRKQHSPTIHSVLPPDQDQQDPKNSTTRTKD